MVGFYRGCEENKLRGVRTWGPLVTRKVTEMAKRKRVNSVLTLGCHLSESLTEGSELFYVKSK